MGFTDFFKRKEKVVTETKTVGIPVGSFDRGSFLDYIVNGGSGLQASQAMVFYRSASSVATAVDAIADEIEFIDPVIKSSDGKIISESPVLDLLRNPNGIESQTDFLGQLARNWLLTHNATVFAAGNVNSKPVELWAVNPREVSSNGLSTTEVYPRGYRVMNGVGRGSYHLNENAKGWRYYSGDMKEIYIIRGYSSRTDNSFGDSPLEAAALEARQQIQGKYHNLKLLENGARLSAFVMLNGITSQEQLEKARQSINEQLTGSGNAGKVMVAGVDGEMVTADFKELGLSNKDMDYANLDEVARQSIYNRYKVPLPLVSQDASTFNNLQTSIGLLYDRAVLPNYQKIMDGLERLLFPRFGVDLNKFTLTYNEESIPALQTRRLDELSKMKEIGVYTINELRAKQPNLEPIDGGDTLYQPATLVPVGQDLFADNDFTEEELRRQVGE
ncbi:MAG: putative portal protein [Prokaryotic dsDNA virus sp.]|nr:MAG: putative portal protein [Prokaryotic dsDNA virus sp.]|tara:strand:- start:8725 stop:10059 length:1335 start_codon:yes stop_codon:yes gene_type:complete